ncbi:MAG: MaoC family dehydratase N-terminal domain-containing protein [Chloroflexi bacterium]|nr:MaoC family dehydratase N-terminal domain-containing protein [Chloroflexota bacterium]
MSPTRSTFFEDVRSGQELPHFRVTVNIQQLVRYAEGARDYARIHTDDEAGKKSQWGSVILHGMIKSGFLAKAAGDFAGLEGLVRRIKIYYRRPDLPSDPLTIGGSVVKTYEPGGDRLADLELWLRNGKGEVSTTAEATVALPSKAGGRARWMSLPADLDVPAGDPTQQREWEFPDPDKVKASAGQPWQPRSDVISAFWIRLFCRGTGDMNPLYVDEAVAARGQHGTIIAPPTFPAALDPFYFWQEEVQARPPQPSRGLRVGGNGWDDFEHFAAIRPGDTITAFGRWLEPFEKPGRNGTLVFIPREVVYVNQHQHVAARSRGAIIQVRP